jgi:hypothetical protein
LTPEQSALEGHYPLVIPGIEVIRDLSHDPAPPVDLDEENLKGWKAMPLAKRRLPVYGSLEAGQTAARMSAIILSAECRVADIPLEVALCLCEKITFTTDRTSRRRVLKQIRRAAEFGYAPPDGTQILTGCCRDPRPKSGAAVSTTLRRYIAPYCDGACAATCPMLRAIRFPGRSIAETEYADADDSDLWQPGSGYGQAGRRAYRELALLARLTPDRTVTATSTYLALRLDGDFTHDHLGKLLRRLAQGGLIERVEDDPQGLPRWHVPVLPRDELRKLEAALRVRGKRAANIRAARRVRTRYADLMTDDGKIAAWGGQ